MAETFHVNLVTPTGVVYEGQIEQVIAVSADGEFVVLPNHADIRTSLVPGVITFKLSDGSSPEYLLAGGFAEVKDGVMTVRASEVTPLAAVDPASPAGELQIAEQRFAQISFYEPGYREAKEALQVARARFEISKLRRTPH
jgi:F-type H+-transporting ATPase subunit epsilon